MQSYELEVFLPPGEEYQNKWEMIVNEKQTHLLVCQSGLILVIQDEQVIQTITETKHPHFFNTLYTGTQSITFFYNPPFPYVQETRKLVDLIDCIAA